MEGHDALSKYLFKIGYKYFRISETKGNSPMKEDEEEQQLRTALLHKFSVPNYAPYHEDVWRYSFMHSQYQYQMDVSHIPQYSTVAW
jgi:hypothetical protein